MIPANMYIPLGVIVVLGFVVYAISMLGDRRERHKAADADAGTDEHDRPPAERRSQPALR